MKPITKKQKQNQQLKQLLNCNLKHSNRYTTSDLKKYSKFESYQIHLFNKHMEHVKRKHPTWSDLKYFSRMRNWYVHRGYMLMYSKVMQFINSMFNYGLLSEYEYRQLIKIENILNELIVKRSEEYVNIKQSRFTNTEMLLPFNSNEIVDAVLKDNTFGSFKNLQF